MDFINFDYTLLIRLVVAVLLGGIIGLERGGHNHEAGLRTHMILCLGSALVMVISVCVCEKYEIYTEMLRMSAQVLSGIGFLGAGSIIANGSKIRGITTAAGLWTTACVGIAVGAGYYVLASAVVFLMLIVILGLKPIKKRIETNSKLHHLEIEVANKEPIQAILDELSKNETEICNIQIDDQDAKSILLGFEIKFAKRASFSPFLSKIIKLDGVKGFRTLD